jgi:23S rRNA pseudouridine1911/1915/1917 synthase
MERQSFTVAPEATGITLAQIASDLLGARALDVIARGGAYVDGRRTRDSASPLPAGAHISFRLPPAEGYSDVMLTAADLCYEDAWLIAIHKRSGWYVGATPWDDQGNVLAALERYLTARDGAPPRLHLAHQLDRDTAGVLLLSKDPAVNPALQRAFAGGTVQKRYRAICAGVPPPTGDIRTGHGRAAGGRWRIYPLEDVGRELPHGGGRVRMAHTSYQVLQATADAALLDVTLHTGRTHQIRLHMAHIGHPLLGDARYGGPTHYHDLALAGHLLHAATLQLAHPISGERLELESPLQEPMQTIIRAMA